MKEWLQVEMQKISEGVPQELNEFMKAWWNYKIIIKQAVETINEH